jgi:hypothetical protein
MSQKAGTVRDLVEWPEGAVVGHQNGVDFNGVACGVRCAGVNAIFVAATEDDARAMMKNLGVTPDPDVPIRKSLCRIFRKERVA